MRSRITSNADQRPVGVERLERARMQFAEMAEHILRPDLDRAGAAGMKPGRPAGHDLQRLHRRAGARPAPRSASALASNASTAPGALDQWRPAPAGLRERAAHAGRRGELVLAAGRR